VFVLFKVGKFVYHGRTVASWYCLSDIKNSFPLHLAKYAVANGLKHEPAFALWVHHTIKKEKHSIKTMKI
jgi:hypothetical protein